MKRIVATKFYEIYFVNKYRNADEVCEYLNTLLQTDNKEY